MQRACIACACVHCAGMCPTLVQIPYTYRHRHRSGCVHVRQQLREKHCSCNMQQVMCLYVHTHDLVEVGVTEGGKEGRETLVEVDEAGGTCTSFVGKVLLWVSYSHFFHTSPQGVVVCQVGSATNNK